jgi:hypothetical protein
MKLQTDPILPNDAAGLAFAVKALMRRAATVVNGLVDGLSNVDNTADIDKPVSTAQQAAINAAASVGISQTWQNLTASRAAGVTYTNSTGRPITVAVTAISSVAGATNLDPFIDGVQQPGQAVAASAAAYRVKDTFVVPVGSTYRADITGSSSPTLWSWFELR